MSLPIARSGQGPFRYRRVDGAPLSKAELAHAKSVYVPPTYTDVRISARPQKLLASARDSKGREQRVYSKGWKESRSKQKFARMSALGKALPRIEAALADPAKLPPEQRDAALALALSRHCAMRPGSTQSVRENGHYGATTLLRKHLSVRGPNLAVLEFPGKKGVANSCAVRKPKLVRALADAKKSAARERRTALFHTGAESVNRFLKRYGEFSAKDLRTWGANEELVRALRRVQFKDETPKQQLKRAVASVAAHLNNTPSVARSSYLDPKLLEAFERDPKAFRQRFRGNVRAALLRWWR